MSDDDERLGGGPIYRHGDRTKRFTLALGSEDTELIEAHIEREFGSVASVFHELLSDLVHVDVHHIAPTAGRPFSTLVTTGMSDLPMSSPEGHDDLRFAELLIHLPPEWPISDDAFEDERFYWPVRLIKTLARFPHEFDTWLWWGHTIPNGDPAESYDASVKFVGALLKESSIYSPAATQLACSSEKTVQFFAVAPLFAEEMDFKLRKGAEALLDRWERRSVLPELITPSRRNVARRTWWPF